VPVFRDARRAEVLRAAISEIGQRNDYHILEMDMDNYWVRLLLSLRPGHAPAKVVQTIKTNASRAVFEACPEAEAEMGQRSLWSRGYYVRGVGDITKKIAKTRGSWPSAAIRIRSSSSTCARLRIAWRNTTAILSAVHCGTFPQATRLSQKNWWRMYCAWPPPRAST
jgi:REP element-mobilizing transposase RayT